MHTADLRVWTSLCFVTSGPISAMDAHLLKQLLSLVCKHLCAVLCAVLSCSVVSDSLQPHGLYSARLLCPWDSPGKNTGVGCRALLQEIFLIQGSNPGLLHCRQIFFFYCLSHQGSPWALEWVAYPVSKGSSWPRNQTGLSCIAGGFFTSWATREASLIPC